MSSFFSNSTSNRRSGKRAHRRNGSSAFGADSRQSVENLSATYTDNPTAGAIAVHTSGYTERYPPRAPGLSRDRSCNHIRKRDTAPDRAWTARTHHHGLCHLMRLDFEASGSSASTIPTSSKISSSRTSISGSKILGQNPNGSFIRRRSRRLSYKARVNSPSTRRKPVMMRCACSKKRTARRSIR